MPLRSGFGSGTGVSISTGCDTPLVTTVPHGLQPACAVPSGAQGNAGGAQAVIGRVEVDRAQGPGRRLAHGEPSERRVTVDALQIPRRQLKLKFKFLTRGTGHGAGRSTRDNIQTVIHLSR